MRYDIAKKKLNKVNDDLIEMLAQRNDVERFLNTLRKIDAPMTEYSENLLLNPITIIMVVSVSNGQNPKLPIYQ